MLPSPPAVLPPRPGLYEIAAGDLLVRFYNPAHGGWSARRSYGPLPQLRFDHHQPPPGSGSDRSVWYAATSLLGAVAEAFGNHGFIDRGSGRRVCVIRVREPIAVLDLVGAAPRKFGNSSPCPTAAVTAGAQGRAIGRELEGEGDCAGLAESCQERLPQIGTGIEPADLGRSQQRVEQCRNVGTPLGA